MGEAPRCLALGRTGTLDEGLLSGQRRCLQCRLAAEVQPPEPQSSHLEYWHDCSMLAWLVGERDEAVRYNDQHIIFTFKIVIILPMSNLKL